MHRIVVLAWALVAAAVLVGSAAADGAYRTEHLPLTGVAGAPGGGSVTNIHTNGPVLYAHEIYTLRHVVPGTYAIALHIFTDSTECLGTGVTVPTASITTNDVGNGAGDASFTPADAEQIRGLTIGINWTATGPATYVSPCTVVVLD